MTEKRKGMRGEWFGVVAGGPRLAALEWLVERGLIDKDAGIPCSVFNAARRKTRREFFLDEMGQVVP